MILYPAIDIMDQKAVRLTRGDYSKKTIYSEDPLEVARDFCKKGATHIHVVDLDGAKAGKTRNFQVISEIKKNTGLFMEVGGGIRDKKTVEAYLDAGVDAVILGTAALKNPTFAEEAIKEYGQKIIVSIDLINGKVATNGWTTKEDITDMEAFERFCHMGVETMVCTDISKDGMLQGTNLPLYEKLQNAFPVNIIASGGVSSKEDIMALKQMDIYGAIVGKAYYEGTINMEEIIGELS
ncbi:MAG: 1-(5-phosphoribosyl)-5-[(5-phosphoribosylamino)methylideneamino]imidazole-4-carboxamide isomerase [Lachnospiraceae bacterium]|nr:1-(5-phosphoribosyl)-5-[(5-phosphoribosylamino)methylideneamino]imidazole-4-carboxamide isomerase [Lachnospiraceae bacterium]